MKQRFIPVSVDALPGEILKPVVIRVQKYEGRWRLDIRHHYLRNGEFVPSRDGINIPMSLNDKFLEALEAVISESKGVGV